MSELKETDANHMSTGSTPKPLSESAPKPEAALNHCDRPTKGSGDATRDDSLTDATESDPDTDPVESELHSSIVSLAEEFDFEVVGHGGDFKWAQGQRKQSIATAKSHHCEIENRNGPDTPEINSPYDSCSTTPAPASPTVQKKSVDATVPSQLKVNVASVPTCRMGGNNSGIGKAKTVQRLPTRNQDWVDSALEKGLDLARVFRKSITDCLNTMAWTPYPIALYTIHACLIAISIGSVLLFLLPFFRNLPKDQQIVVDQDFPVPTGIFLSNAETRQIPVTYTLLEGWSEPVDTVYRFRISATDSDGKPRRQGLDYISAVVTLTPLSSEENIPKNMPILLRARGEADGSYTFAVSDPGSGVGTVVVDIYAATRAHIEKAGLKHGAGVGYQIEGSPFVIRGKAVNEKEHGKDPSNLGDESERKNIFTDAWQYIQNVIPCTKLQNRESQIHALAKYMSASILDTTMRLQSGAQILNNRVFDMVVAANEKVATFVKRAVEHRQESVGQDTIIKDNEAKSKVERPFVTNLQKHIATLRDCVNKIYGNAKLGVQQVAAKVPFLASAQDEKARSEKEPLLKKAQNELRKLESYLEAKKKQMAESTRAKVNQLHEKSKLITETTRAKGKEMRDKLGDSIQRGLVGVEKWAQESVLAIRRKGDQVITTVKKAGQTQMEKESSWMSFRRAMSAFTGGRF